MIAIEGLSRIPSQSHNPELQQALASRPDRNSTFVLEQDRTVVLIMHEAGGAMMAVTLREIQDGKAFVQFGYSPGIKL